MDMGSPESLPSEDWISQPRSSANVSLQGGSFPTGSLTSISRSRIPRHTRSTSNSSHLSRSTTNNRPFSPCSSLARTILNERTASALNISEMRSSSRRKGGNTHSEQLDSRNLTRVSSVTSQSSCQLGTVQHKNRVKLGKNGVGTKATPEWKRRVLPGGITSGRQQDLFSPIGLEKVFSSTTAAETPSKPNQRKSKRFEAVAVGDYPSSPPPYPSTKFGKGRQDIASLESPRSTSSRKQTAVQKDGQIFGVTTTSRTDLGRVSPEERQESYQSPNYTERGESDSRNESISIVQITNGRINWDSVAKPRAKLRINLRHPRKVMDRPQSRSSDSALHSVNDAPSQFQPEDHDYPELTTQSLPEGLSIDTDAFASRGGFVNLRRGGYSMSDSFQKRPLSPSSFQASELSVPSSSAPFRERQGPLESQAVDGSARRNEEADSNQLPPVPTTPKKSNKDGNTPELQRSSGSPLKLFDNYDSFTNDRLVRRMSQFEHNVLTSPNSNATSPQAPEAREFPFPKTKIASKQAQAGMPDRRLSSFGDGYLDEFDFSLGSPDGCNQSFVAARVNGGRRNSRRSPRSSQGRDHKDQAITSSGRGRQSFRNQSILGDGTSSVPRTSTHQHIQIEGHPQNHNAPYSRSQPESVLEMSDSGFISYNADGKRCLASLSRASNPKRRRTITGSVDSSLSPACFGGGAQHSFTHSILPQKRKDARYEHSNQLADPDVIASRTRLRPRALTQSRSHGSVVNGSTNGYSYGEDLVKPVADQLGDADQSFADEPVQALAGELAHFALDIAQDITYGTRKTSVTTADFTKQAKLIMQNIRAQALPRSGRTSEQNTGLQPLEETEESINEGSTREAFSRPPSREGGGTLRNLRGPILPDPRVVSHLRKFEENDDTINVHFPVLRRSDPLEDETGSQILESDPPNIRILGSISRESSHGIPADLVNDSLSTHGSDHKLSRQSPPSSGPSTAQTFPTGSSGGSGNKAIIPPDKVSHLLSDNVAGMTFDRTRKVWLRKKSAESHNDGIPGSDMTEEDPLKEIPDLSVDEAEELKLIQIANSSSPPPSSGAAKIANTERSQRDSDRSNNKEQQTFNEPISTEMRRDNTVSSESDNNRSMESHDAKNSPRTTSTNEPTQIPKDLQPGEINDDEEEIEHEFSILDGRSPATPKQSMRNYRHPRVVTVAFSSPLIHSTFEPQAQADMENGNEREDESSLCLDESPEREVPEERYSGYRKPSQGSRSRSGYRRRRSSSANNFVGRPISRIDEHDELLLTDYTRPPIHNSSMNVVLSTPQAFRGAPEQMTVAALNDKPSDLTFYLSPLSDFTVDQREGAANRQSSRSLNCHGLLSKHDSDSRYSLTIQELVQKITDVEPYEPYWEYLRKLSLQNKDLTSLHMLDDFCSRVDDLDVSNNRLGQLEGVPMTVRSLNIRNNCISSLTPWGHLRNLQYIDVSSNHLQNLEGFSGLIHLRELIADDNHIESLDGVKGLNGLLKLRLRRNKIEILDFQGAEMDRLIELDLQGNRITVVNCLHELPALENLNLRHNSLANLLTGTTTEVPSLQTLDVSNNRLTTINMARFPNLQLLQLDRNCLDHIPDSKDLNSLTTVSWREQEMPLSGANININLDAVSEVSTLRLSGNKFQIFAPTVSFLNLQRLELAFTGLESLSDDFGPNMPNLRYLNLNHNALKDLRPLLGIQKLVELQMAGNRITRLRRTAAVLGKLGSTLKSIDLRNNPLTIGFYAPLGRQSDVEQQIVSRSQQGNREEENEEDFAAAAYVVARADEHADRQYCHNLAEDTALRRRVYEMLVLGGCPILADLDGRPIERRDVETKDALWRRLLALGVLQENGNDS